MTQTIHSILEVNRNSWGCDFVGIAINVSQPGVSKDIRWHYVVGNLGEDYKKIRLTIGKGIAGMVWRTARSQQEQHILQDKKKLIFYPIGRLEQLDSVLGVPLFDGRDIIGVLLIAYRSYHLFSPGEIAMYEEKAAEIQQVLREALYG